MRREFAPLFLMALRASGGTGRHAEAARHVVFVMLIAQLLAASDHDRPPHGPARAPRHVRSRRSRLPHRDTLSGRRPRG